MISPTDFKPQLVGEGNIDYFLFNNEVAIMEPKIDGVRCLMFKDGDEIRFYSRNGKDWTERFADITPHLKDIFLTKQMVIDGEMAVTRNGEITTSSTALRKKLDKDLKRVFFAFDLLELDGQNMMEFPLMHRKQHLHLISMDNERYNLVPFQSADNKEDVLEFYKKCIGKFEGIVIKNLKPYYPNSRFNWLKLKPIKTLDVEITGKGRTKDNKMFLYDLRGEGVDLCRVMSGFDAPIGSTVEICYETAKTETGQRMKFPKILRVRQDK
jgi:bifunctional non-homologous end joining protein LigD